MIPKKCIVHHSLTSDSQTVSWGAIRRYHKETNGWIEIGYHYGIELVGDSYEVLVGRPENIAGAHCKGLNALSIGICFIGNFDIAAPSDEMMIRATEVFYPILRRLVITPEDIHPHSAYAPKSCPGTMFPMARFVEAMRTGVWK